MLTLTLCCTSQRILWDFVCLQIIAILGHTKVLEAEQRKRDILNCMHSETFPLHNITDEHHNHSIVRNTNACCPNILTNAYNYNIFHQFSNSQELKAKLLEMSRVLLKTTTTPSILLYTQVLSILFTYFKW